MPLSEILLQLFPTLPYKWHRALGLLLVLSVECLPANDFEYLGLQFTGHFNVNFRFYKETPHTFQVSRGKIFCYLPHLFIPIS